MAHEIEKLPVSAELLKCSSLPAVCGYFISTHCIRRSYYRTRVQESEGIVQDALGRLTCLVVPPPPPSFPPPPPLFLPQLLFYLTCVQGISC
jgi:hypothetical protein